MTISRAALQRGERLAFFVEAGMQDGERLKVLTGADERLADMRRYL
ncbi:MAG: hypothetical protein IPP90_16880 [Gemmatimonadaceae bacterium]|nr:hypothetical protein [Gemmatimonadaceae bacterium]